MRISNPLWSPWNTDEKYITIQRVFFWEDIWALFRPKCEEMLRAKDIGNLVESEVEEYGQMGKGGRLVEIREHTEPCGAKIMMDVP